MKKIFKNKTFIELFIIFLLGLTPLLWFKNDLVIAGHDAGLPLDPIAHFLDRLYVWTERFGFGADQSVSLSGLFIHGSEAFVSSIVHSLQAEQKIIFIFWFVLPGITMYYFASKIAQKHNLKYFTLPVVIFYMFNHFLLQGWFIVERTKFSLYAALPLILSLLFDWKEGKRGAIKTSLLISLILLFLNGGGSLPLFGGIIIAFLAFIIFYLVKEFSIRNVSRIFVLILVTIITSIFLNAYWILPYGYYSLHSYSTEVLKAGGVAGILGWIRYISQETSFVNLFRLQGIPDWYNNVSHPYANIFLENPILIIISLLIPILAFSSLLIVKKKEVKEKILFFAFLALLSMFFSAGSHPPFGAMYLFLVNNLPGFIAFRTPFYKFAPALWFSYAILIGFALNYYLNIIEKKKLIFSKVLLALFCTGVILYSFPFLTGSFFDYSKSERSTRIKVPDYILRFGEWSQSPERKNKRTLVLPPLNFINRYESYSWGYWSLTPLTSLITNSPMVNQAGLTKNEIEIVDKLYWMMKTNEPGWQDLSKFLGIESFLLRKDINWNSKDSLTDKPSMYTEALKESDLLMAKKFGEWEVYDFKGEKNNNNITVASSLSYLYGDVSDLDLLFSLPNMNIKDPIYVSGDPVNNSIHDLENLTSEIYIKANCIMCNLQWKKIEMEAYIPSVTRGSFLYPLLEIKEKKAKEQASISKETLIKFYLYKSLKNILGLQGIINDKKGAGIMISTIDDYDASLEKIDKIIRTIDDKSLISYSDLLIEVNSVFIKEKTILAELINLPKTDNFNKVFDNLNVSHSLLKQIMETINRRVWKTEEEDVKRLTVDIPKAGNYDLFYDSNDSLVHDPKVSFTIDDINYNTVSNELNPKWFYLGQYDLQNGLHKMELRQKSFNLYTGTDTSSIDSSLIKSSCFFSNKISGERKDVYRVSFAYKYLKGDKKIFSQILPFGNKPNPYNTADDEIIFATSDSNNYKIDYVLKKDEDLYLAVCTYPSIEERKIETAYEISNINIRKISSPNFIFYNSLTKPVNGINMNYKKISSSEYNLKLDFKDNNKAVVVLNDSYDLNWVIKNGTNKSFMINGHANGWIVDKNQDTIAVIYQSQDLAKYGFYISIISLLSIIGPYILFKVKLFLK